jgi:Ca2+-binding RTX toxin-like protein
LGVDASHPVLCTCSACRAGASADSGVQGAAPAATSNSVMPASLSGTQYIDAVLSPVQYRWTNSAPGTPLTLSYGFMTTMPWYSYSWNNESGPFQAFTAVQQDGVNRAVQMFESVCNVDFVYRADGDNAQVRFGTAVLQSWEAAHAYYPDPTGDWSGDVWFNSSDPSVPNQTAGTYGFLVTLHEMGHALGLKHSFDGGSFGIVLPADKDTRQYTVMSYSRPPTMAAIEASSLMLYDIAALQYLYGVNTSYKTGNDTWRWATDESFRYCIWDAAGNDTIDASNQTRRVVINLNPGTFSSLGAYRGLDATDNLSIAFNCWIENAIGGGGADTLTGNQLANRLEGGGGNDSIDGGAGNDTLIGGSGNDTLKGGSGADTIDGGAGFDTVSYENATGGVVIDLSGGGNTENWGQAGDTLTGIEAVIGSMYIDHLAGDAGDNWLIGGGDLDLLTGGAGADRLDGGQGPDTAIYTGSSAGVNINLSAGTASGGDATGDTLISIENLDGSNYADVLTGDAGQNTIRGFDGNDIIDGGAGADQLDGGAGDDIFYVDNPSDMVYGGDGYDEERSTSNVATAAGGIEKLVFIGTGDFTGRGLFDAITIVGGAGDDKLYGNYGVDTLIGGDGNDILSGGYLGDTLDGGAGIDLASYEGSSTGVTVDLQTGARSGDAVGDVFIGIEGLIGGRYDDTLSGTAADESFIGGGGNDVIDGRGGYDVVTFSGSARDYDVTTVGGATIVTAKRSSVLQLDGSDTLYNIESIRFSGSVTNHAPVAWGASNSGLSRIAGATLATLVSSSDADFDSIVAYEFRDLTPGLGYFTVNGVVQSANQTFRVDYADLFTSTFRPGLGVDTVQARSFDGVDWSDWVTFPVAPQNSAPVFSTHAITAPHNVWSLTATSLFTVSDPDSDPITLYEFRDNTVGNGYFQIGGTARPTPFQVTAAELADTRFMLMSVPSASDWIEVRAFDGIGWSGWASVTIASPTNTASVVAGRGVTLSRGTSSVAASSLITVSDADGDTTSRYRFFDGTVGNGRFMLNSAPQAEYSNIEITAAQLADFRFALGPAGSSDVLWAQVFDGFVWSSWTSFTLTAPQNTPPAAAVRDRTATRGTTSLAAASLVSATDPDGDAITAYRFFDGTQGNGHFRKNGVDQPEMVNISVSSAELATTDFVLGGGSDVLWVQVYDGASWSAWQSFNVLPPQNNAPAISINAANLSPGRATATVAASSFFSVSDADGDAMTQYRFFDGTSGNGRFELNGTPQAELANITVAASDLATFVYRTSVTGAGDTLWVQAFDGISWGTWKSFNVTAPQNNAPVITVNGGSLNPGRATPTIAASSFFSVNDADGDSITQYRFFDGNAGNGRFELNGNPQAELANLTINASDLASLTYRVSGTGTGDTLWVQASDGTSWGAWKSFNVAAPQNSKPVVTAADRSVSASTAVAMSTLFSVSDADGDAITRYQLWHANPAGGSFRIGGTVQATSGNVDVLAGQLAAADFLSASTAASDQLWVRANDGAVWSDWKVFSVTTLASS